MVPEKVNLQISARNPLFISLRLSIFAADLNPPLACSWACFSRRLTNEHKLFSQNARTRGPQHLLFQRGALWARVPTQTRPKPRADRRALQRRLRLRRQVRRAFCSALRGTRRFLRPSHTRCSDHDGGRGCRVDRRLADRLRGRAGLRDNARLPCEPGAVSRGADESGCTRHDAKCQIQLPPQPLEPRAVQCPCGAGFGSGTEVDAGFCAGVLGSLAHGIDSSTKDDGLASRVASSLTSSLTANILASSLARLAGNAGKHDRGPAGNGGRFAGNAGTHGRGLAGRGSRRADNNRVQPPPPEPGAVARGPEAGCARRDFRIQLAV